MLPGPATRKGRTTMKNRSKKSDATNAARADAMPPAAGDGMAGDKLVTRGEASKILGIGYNTVKRWEGTKLHPTIDAQGIRWFREEEVRALARRLRASEGSEDVEDPSRRYDGETARRVFRMLDDGKLIADVVIELGLHPSVAREIAREWSDLRGGLILGAEVLARLSAMPCISFGDEVRTEAEFVEALESVSVERCEVCEHNAAQVCLSCVIRRHGHVLAFAKKLAAREAERAKEIRERRVRADAERSARKAAAKSAAAPPARAARARAATTAEDPSASSRGTSGEVASQDE
jgi:hypothetical protein